MARSFAEVRDDISDRVAGLSGWVVVDVPADLFGPDVVPDAVPSAPQRTPFAVGIASSTPVDALSRQRVAGQHVFSEVTVRFLAPVKAKAKLEVAKATAKPKAKAKAKANYAKAPARNASPEHHGFSKSCSS